MKHNISEFCQVQTRIIDQLMKFPQQLIMRRQLVINQTKNVECDICHGKFTKQGLTRHRNSCKAKNKASNNKGKAAK